MSVTWNGTTLTGPTLIYLDEIILDGIDFLTLSVGDPNRPGALVCRSETQPTVFWNNPLGLNLHQTVIFYGDIQQIQNAQRIPNFSRVSRGTEETESFTNGLFTCRIHAASDLEELLATFVHVGIYIRENPQGKRHANVYTVNP